MHSLCLRPQRPSHPGCPPKRRHHRLCFNREDNLISYQDENGAVTRLKYCGLGEITRRIQADGYSVQYHYDTEERLVGVTNQRKETYQLKHDALGRIVGEVDYWGQGRRYTYDAGGYITSATDPLGRTIQYATDPLGRILEKTLPDGFSEAFAYDANGNLIETRNPYGAIKREFDAEGRLTHETQGDFSIKNTYNVTGNRIARETNLGNVITYAFDPLEQVSAIRINQGEPMRIGRDAGGRITHERLTRSSRAASTTAPTVTSRSRRSRPTSYRFLPRALNTTRRATSSSAATVNTALMPTATTR